MTLHSHWPFAARLIVVSAALSALLAAAIIMLLIGRAVPVRDVAAHTHTTVKPLGRSHAPRLSTKNGAPIVPAGLPTKDIGPAIPALTPAERRAHAHAVLLEHAAAIRFSQAAAHARLLHADGLAGARPSRAPHRRGYNRRSLRP